LERPYHTRGAESFSELDSMLSGVKEVELVRDVITEDKVNGRQSPIISLYHFLEMPSIGFREKYLTIDASIKGTETPEGHETIINNPRMYTAKDAVLSTLAIIEDKARVALMLDYLQKKGIQVKFEAGFDAQDVLGSAKVFGLDKRYLMEHKVLSEYLNDCASPSSRDAAMLERIALNNSFKSNN
jgi:hypothetical protein